MEKWELHNFGGSSLELQISISSLQDWNSYRNKKIEERNKIDMSFVFKNWARGGGSNER